MKEIYIRKAELSDAEEIASVHIQAWKESYAGIVVDDYLQNIDYQSKLLHRKQIIAGNQGENINLVAVCGNSIVGFCDAGPGNKLDAPGEVFAIYLLQNFKRIGVGDKLFNSAKKHLVKNKLVPFLAWVLSENLEARKFYEKEGGEEFRKKMVEIGGKLHEEVSYIFLNPIKN
ncbi:MAG: GNAT family N-acetyltransferase [Gammaproteobacteria bacterium]|nr:GNAT family N-acetyltransferase [Gammaproteobacteria bacterium]